MLYVAAITKGSAAVSVVTYVGRPTHFRKKASRIAGDVRGHLKEGLDVQVIALNFHARASLSQWGTLTGN